MGELFGLVYIVDVDNQRVDEWAALDVEYFFDGLEVESVSC